MAGRRDGTFARYAAIVETALPDTPTPDVAGEPEGVVAVERGLIFPRWLKRRRTGLEPWAGEEDAPILRRLIDLQPRDSQLLPDVADRRGHRRPAYLPLLIYAWLQAFRIGSSSAGAAEVAGWRAALAAWCQRLLPDALALGSQPALPAADGAWVGAAGWAALVLATAAGTLERDDWAAAARAAFSRLAALQQPGGAFLLATPADNPETLWYHELVLLHAAASYAVQTGDETVWGAVGRAAAFHLAETQPDHATSQPWGLFAFAAGEATQPLADQMLHAAATQSVGATSGRSDAVTSILLADALYCLEAARHSPLFAAAGAG